MGKVFSRGGFLSSAAMIAVMICGQLTVLAQSSGNMGASSTSGVSAQQLSTGFAALQQLLQKWHSNPAQTQRATALLAAVQNAFAGGTLNGTQVRQIGQAIAAARKAKQSSNSTATPLSSQTGGLLGGSATNAISTQQLNTAFAAVQQLLQSGILNPAQTQRATALLTAVQSAIESGSLNGTQLQQMGLAIASARKLGQSSNSTTASTAARMNKISRIIHAPLKRCGS